MAQLEIVTRHAARHEGYYDNIGHRLVCSCGWRDVIPFGAGAGNGHLIVQTLIDHTVTARWAVLLAPVAR